MDCAVHRDLVRSMVFSHRGPERVGKMTNESELLCVWCGDMEAGLMRDRIPAGWWVWHLLPDYYAVAPGHRLVYCPSGQCAACEAQDPSVPPGYHLERYVVD